MLKTLLATLPAFALAGALMVGNAATADNYDRPGADEPFAGDTIPGGDVAQYDAEKNCWVARPPMTAADNPEPNEPEARFDAARECVAYGTTPPPSVAEDHGPIGPDPDLGG